MKKALIAIGVISAIALGAIVYLTINVQSRAVSKFPTSGYILDTDSVSGKADFNQLYFNGGERFTRSSSNDTISFKTIDGEKATVGKASYIHYSDDSLQAMTKTVVFDTDDTNQKSLSYIAIPVESILEKSGNDYMVTNPDGTASSFRNFVWKISDNDYMVLSSEIKLVVTDELKQTFPDYVQVKYRDSGVVLLTTQQGVYSTVSSDAYLELANGVRIYLGSKNVSTGESGGIVCNLTQLMINSDDSVELAPDDEYNNENTTQPQLVVDASDGEDGEEGEPGKAGEAGEAGKNGAKGEDGEEGEDGEQGEDGEAGQTGKAGEAGKNGENGSNGNPGNPGATGAGGAAGEEGDPGTTGDNASTAYLVFTSDKLPEFRAVIKTSMTLDGQLKEMKSTADAVLVSVSYEDEDATWLLKEDTLKVTIYETESGNVAATAIPKNMGISVKAAGFDVPFTGLKPATNYTMIISANLEDTSKNVVPRDLLTKYFVTESVGVALTTRYVTSDSVDFYLTRTSSDPITHVCINLFDSEKNRLVEEEDVKTTFLVPTNSLPDDAEVTGEPGYVYDCKTGRFSIAERLSKVGDRFEVIAGIFDYTTGDQKLKMEGLKSDTVYYAQIVAYEETDSGLYSELSEYTFPMVRFKTLRKEPVIEAPVIKLSGYENAFIVSARSIDDPDNGIVSYRYEVYEYKSDGTLSEDPIYTVSSATATSVNVPITGNISIGKKYKARIVAQFNNNEIIVDCPSDFSSEFNLDKALPKVTADTPVITASTISGKITVSDTAELLSKDVTNYLRVMIVPQDDLTTGTGKYSDRYSGKMQKLEVGKVQVVAGVTDYTIPYYAQGLKENTSYEIYVYADYCKDPTVTNASGQPEEQKDYQLTRPIVYKTIEYTPIKLNAVKGVPLATDGKDGSTAPQFKYYAYFTSANQSVDEANSSTKLGDNNGNDIGHFSSKAMQWVTFELWYKGSKVGTLKTWGPDSYTVYDTGSGTKDDNPTRNYVFDFDDAQDILRNKARVPRTGTGASVDKIYKLYLENGKVPKVDGTGDIDEAQCISGKIGVPITSDSFTDARAGKTGTLNFSDLNYQSGDKLQLKAVVYDYTYFTGGATALWRYYDSETEKKALYDYANGITVSNVFEFEIDTQKPDFDAIQQKAYKAKAFTKGEAVTGNYVGNIFKVDSTKSNYVTDLEKTKWDVESSNSEMFDDTTVGLHIYGPDCETCNLIDYSGWVKYTVYKTISTPIVGGKERKFGTGEPVAQSGWMKVTDKDEFPDWYFLIDATDVKRGENFYVKTEVKLNNHLKASVEISGTTYKSEDRVYPTDFIVDGDITDVNKKFHDEVFTDVDGEIIQTFCYDKQIPLFSIVPWDGTLLDSTDKETYLIGLNDLDEALIADTGYSDYKTNFSKIQFYYGASTTTDGSDTITNRLALNDLSADSTTNFKYKLVDVQRADRASKYLKYRYKLSHSKDPQTEILDQYSAAVIKGSETSLVSVTEDPLTPLSFSYSNGNANLDFWFKDTDGGSGLKRADLELVFYNSSSDTQPVTFVFDDIKLTAAGSYTKTATGEKFYHRTAEVAVISTLNSKLKQISAKNYLAVTVTGYSDSGNYGLKYADYVSGSGTLMYTLQKQTNDVYCDPTGSSVSGMNKAIFTAKWPLKYISLPTPTSKGKIKIFYDETSAQANKDVPYKDGIEMIPRQVAFQSIAKTGITNPLKNSNPDYKTTKNVGLTELSLGLSYYVAGIESVGQLVNSPSDGMIMVVYDKVANASGLPSTAAELATFIAGDTTNKKHYSLSSADSKSLHNVAGLDRNTAYRFKVFGYDGTNWSLLYNIDGTKMSYFDITTLDDVPLSIVNIYYESLPGSEDEKTAVVTLNIGTDAQKVSHDDINLSIETMYLKVKQGTTEIYTSADLKAALLAQFPTSEGKKTGTLTIRVPWNPQSAGGLDDSRLMNGSTTYTYDLQIKYKNEDNPKSLATPKVSTPKLWPNTENVKANNNRFSFFLPVMTVGYNAADTAHPDENMRGNVGVSIDGYDELRLYRKLETLPTTSGDVTPTSSNKMTYWVDLYRRNLDGTGVTLVARKYITKDINPTGTDAGSIAFVSKTDCQFTGLTIGKEYMVKVYAFWDTNNDGKVSIDGTVESDKWMTDHTKSECDLKTTDWTVVSKDTVSVTGVAFSIGTDSYARVQGINLEEVTEIIYNLSVNGVSDGTDWKLTKGVDTDDIEHGIVSWSDHWQKDTKQSGYYLLYVPGMTDTNSIYVLTVSFYKGSGASKTLITSRQAVYSKNN